MATELEQAQESARQKADDQAEKVAALVLSLMVSGSEAGGGTSQFMMTWPAQLEKAVATFSKLVGVAALVALVRRNPTKLRSGMSEPTLSKDQVEKLQADIVPIVRKIVNQDIVGPARQRQIVSMATSEPQLSKAASKSWSEMIGRTAATRAASEVAIAMADPVAKLLQTDLRKLWISRGDSRVRPLHRKLHGKTEKVGDAFWRELDSGRELRYPGDPRAPIEQIANCRCGLFLARADEAREAERAFSLDESDFALAAAALVHDIDDAYKLAATDLKMSRLVEELKTSLTAAATPGHTGVVLVLIPDELDEIEYNDGDRAPAHSTLAYLGKIDDATDEEIADVRATAARLAEILPGPFEASVAGLATLGEKQDEVILVEAREIQDLHDVITSDSSCARMLDERNEHPHFVPHVSYPHAKAPTVVRFSKIGCWIGDDRVEYDL